MQEMLTYQGIILEWNHQGWGQCPADYVACYGRPIGHLGLNGDEGLVFKLHDGRE